MFKFDIVFFRLTEQMIVHDSFSVSGGNQGGLNAIWLPHCHLPVKNNKAIIWTNIRTTVTPKARKWEKRKKSKKKKQATRSGVVVWYVIRGPIMFVDRFLRLWRPSNSSQMSSCITVTKIVAIAVLLGWYTAIFVTKFKASHHICLQSHAVGD